MSRYEPILDRAVALAALEAPKDLKMAEERAERHPRSWQPAVELGDALYRSGQPKSALVAYERALARMPDQSRAMVGRLRVYAHYRLRGGLDIAREVVRSETADPRVIVAASELFDAVGSPEEAIEALDVAWEKLRGNGIIRRERLRRGLPVDG